MLCPECGNENLEPASECHVCGANLAPSHLPAEDAAQSPPPSAAVDQPLSILLYESAIGPVNTQKYLDHFARFDARGKAVLTWHWPAFFATLGWMIFRRMWRAALVYAGLATTAALALFGLLPMYLGYSDSLMGAATAAFILFACAPPALLANALYYRHCNQRITQALALAPHIQEAREWLQFHASSRKRALVVGVVVALIYLALAALAAWLWWSTSAPSPTPPAATRHTNPSPRASGPVSGGAVASAASAASTPAPAGTDHVQPIIIPIFMPVMLPMPVPVPIGGPMPAPQAKTVPPSPKVLALAPALAAPVTKVEAAPAKPSAVPAKPTASAAAASPGAGVMVAAGVFAQPENAQRVERTLRGVGLNVFVDRFNGRNGPLTRIRVGPFANREEARQVITQIERLGLSAVVIEGK